MMIDLPPGIEGLIFDCDGTLIDNMPLHFISWRDAFAEHGADFTREFLESTSGLPLVDTVEVFNKEHGTTLEPSIIIALKAEIFGHLVNDAEPVVPVCDVVRKYQGLMPMAVVSGSGRDSVDHSIEHVGLGGCFEAILTADDPFPPKPNPDLFLEAARLIGVDSDKCVVFEDGESGMRGAYAAGMHVIDVRKYTSEGK